MDRLTETRNGKNVIPLRNAVCGIDMPHWSIEEHSPIQSFLSGDAADKLAAYEDAEEQGRLVILPWKNKRKDCPLVPVPPHGRLIDVDALINTLNDNEVKYDSDVNYFLMYAPTVIPASEEGE